MTLLQPARETLPGRPAEPSVGSSAAAGRPSRVVGWAGVALLAVPLALVDAFMVTAVRGGVGSVERTQQPVLTFAEQAVLLLPWLALAVVVATLRPASGRVRRVALLVGLTALAPVAAMAAGAVVDYGLQTGHLAGMAQLHGGCDLACVGRQRTATVVAHLRGIGVGGLAVVLAHLLVVPFLLFLRGTRRPLGLTVPAGRAGAQALLPGLLVVAAAVHLAVVREHLEHWPAAATFFVALAVAEVMAALVTVPPRRDLLPVVLVSAVPLVLWAVSRTVGMPFGPEAGEREAVGVPDLLCVAVEAAALVLAVVLARRNRTGRPAPTLRRPTRLVLALLLVACTAAGVGAAAPWAAEITPAHAAHTLPG